MIETARVPLERSLIDARVLRICAWSVALALIRRPPSVVFPDMSLRDAADHMVREDVGRLPVVDRDDPSRLVGIITRSDLLKVHARRLEEEHG